MPQRSNSASAAVVMQVLFLKKRKIPILTKLNPKLRLMHKPISRGEGVRELSVLALEQTLSIICKCGRYGEVGSDSLK